MIENVKTDLLWSDYYAMALHSSRTGENDAARTLFARAHRECSDDASRLQCSSAFANLLKNGENDKWRCEIKQKQAERTQDWRDFINLATCCIGSIELDKALEAASKALEIGSTRNADAWGSLASVYSLMGKTSESVRCFRNAMELNPEYGQYWALQSAADKDTVHDDIFWHQEFFPAYSTRKTATPCINVLTMDLRERDVLVCMEQGIGDAIMLRRAIYWLAGRCKSVKLLCDQKYLEFYSSFIWPEVTSNGTEKRDIALNLMDLLCATNLWINQETPKPWENFSKLWSSSWDSKILVNFQGNSEFPFEHCRGVYCESARKEILRVIGEDALIVPKTGVSLADLPIFAARSRGICTSDTMILHLMSELQKPVLGLVGPGMDWRFSYPFYKNLSLAVSLDPGKWDRFKLKLAGETEFTHCYSSFEHIYNCWEETVK